MSTYHATYPIMSVHLGGAEYDFLTAYFKIYTVAACPLSSEAPPEALKLAAFHTRQKFTTEI